MIYFLQFVFFFLLFLLIHSYLLYPIVIKFISIFFKDFKNTISIEPNVSIIISAYNEEKVIESRINNITSLNYDLNKIEVLVGSDNSNDRTNEILLKLKEKYTWLKFYSFKERRGKASVLNDLVSIAKNEILVFTDANTVFDTNMLKKILPHFSNSKIGGVSGRLILSKPKFFFRKDVEEQNYWDYENYLKRHEGKCGIQIGANGGLFAMRRKLFKVIPTSKAVTDDLFVPLSVLHQGYKFLFEHEAFATEEISQKISDEFRRKVRFSATNFQTLFYFKDLLFNKDMLISYALWSHKIIRWFTPIILLFIFLINVILYNNGIFFTWSLIFQIFFYSFSLIGFLLMKGGIYYRVFSIPFYFGMINTALIVGFIKFLFKKHTGHWESTPR